MSGSPLNRFTRLEKVAVFDSVVLSDVVNVPRRSGKSFALTIKFAGNPDE